MKTRTSFVFVIAVVILAAAMALLYYGNRPVSAPGEGGQTVPTDTVISDDGAARLEIPAGALPEGVSLSDVTVTAIDRGDVEPDDAIVGYELKPDGLQLSAPATFTITAAASGFGDAAPMLVHLRGDGEDAEDDLVTEADISIDETADTLSISGDLTHFCDLWAVKGIFNHVIQSSPDHRVGDDFTFIIWTHVNREGSRFIDQNKIIHEFTFEKYGVWFISLGGLTTDKAGYISPDEQRFRPGGPYEERENHIVYGYYTCDEKGEETVGTRNVKLTYPIEHLIRTVKGNRRHKHYMIDMLNKRQLNKCEDLGGWVHVGQPYLIVCDEGAGPTFSGYWKAHPLTGELILDENGEKLDSETGEPVRCP